MLLMLDKYLREIATWHEPTGDFIYTKVPISYRSLFDKALQEKVLLNPGTLYDRSANQFCAYRIHTQR